MLDVFISLIDGFYSYFKKFSPYILGGAFGSLIHRLRTKMSFPSFIGSIIISIFVALSVGIVAKEYFNIMDDIIFVLCGVAGSTSKIILDELEEIIKSTSEIIKARFLPNYRSNKQVNNKETEKERESDEK